MISNNEPEIRLILNKSSNKSIFIIYDVSLASRKITGKNHTRTQKCQNKKKSD